MTTVILLGMLFAMVPVYIAITQRNRRLRREIAGDGTPSA